MTASGSRWANWTLTNLKGQDGSLQGSLRKLADVTVTQVSSLEGHSNQVKYLMWRLEKGKGHTPLQERGSRELKPSNITQVYRKTTCKSSWKSLVFTWKAVPDQPDGEMVDSVDEGRAKTVIYHKFQKFFSAYQCPSCYPHLVKG